MKGELNGVFSEIRKEGYDEGRKEARKDVYNDFLENHTIEEVSEFTGKKPSEILDIINS